MGAGAEDISTKDIDTDSTGSDGGGITGLSTVYFSYDSDALSQETRDTLMQNANWIQTNQITSIELEGHCDIRGSEAYNIGLGTRRAQSVKDFLAGQGVDSLKMSVISYGEERPLSEFAHDRNRRVNFVPVY